MQPTYHTGDLVVLARSSSYHTGQIVAYHGGPTGHLLVLHRIVGGDASGYEIKGDNNQSVDPIHPTARQIIGRAVLHLPKVGAALKPPISRALIILFVLALTGALVMNTSRTPAASKTPHRTRRASSLWKALAALDVLLLLALASTYALASKPEPPATPPTQTGVLTYHADVPISDTYPAGSVSTGDPVFVKLVNKLQVTFRYTTHAPNDSIRGTGRLDALISAPDGWHTNVPLVSPTPFAAGTLDVTGTLDLAHIQALAANVAKATGIPLGLLDVSITAAATGTVDGATPISYTSQLPLQLTPGALTLANVKLSLSPQGPALTSTVALTSTPSAAVPTSHTPHQLRVGILVALILGVGAAVVAAPNSADNSKRMITRTKAVGIHPGHTTRIQLASPSALEQLAATLGCPIVEGDGGWQVALTPGALYWIANPQLASTTTDAFPSPPTTWQHPPARPPTSSTKPDHERQPSPSTRKDLVMNTPRSNGHQL